MSRIIITLLMVLLATGAVADTASHIFWTEWRSYNVADSKIVRANADGTGQVTVLDGFYDGTGVKGLAVDMDNQKLYFANRTTNEIERCNFDGTARETVVAGVYAVGLALDIEDGKIYWSDYSYSDPLIRRADLDGNNIQDLASGSDGCVLEGIVLDIPAGHIYWAERMDQQIWRANMSGGGAVRILNCWEGIGHPCGMGLSGGRLYWGGGGAIASSDLNGEDVQIIVTDLPDSPRSVAIDHEAGQIYWTTSSLYAGYVQRVNLDGTGLTTLATGLRGSYGLALEFGSQSPASDLPQAELKLANYPNPFNPQTMIIYTLPQAGATTVQVLTIDGMLMDTLVDGWQTEGRHEVPWNGCDGNGQAVASGVYLCRLISGTGEATQPVTLIR